MLYLSLTQVKITGMSGERKNILVSASPLRALDGHVVGAVIVIQDLTETKKIEADLESKIMGIIAWKKRLIARSLISLHL
jgi:signal transduction histidine kinase